MTLCTGVGREVVTILQVVTGPGPSTTVTLTMTFSAAKFKNTGHFSSQPSVTPSFLFAFIEHGMGIRHLAVCSVSPCSYVDAWVHFNVFLPLFLWWVRDYQLLLVFCPLLSIQIQSSVLVMVMRQWGSVAGDQLLIWYKAQETSGRCYELCTAALLHCTLRTVHCGLCPG